MPRAVCSCAGGCIGPLLLVAGGQEGDLFTASAALQVFDGAAWTLRAPMPAPRWGAASCVVGGKLVVSAGWHRRGLQTKPCRDTVVYDPATDAWTAAAPLPSPPRPCSTMVTFRGTALLLGGAGPPIALSPALDEWRPCRLGDDVDLHCPELRYWAIAAVGEL